MSEHTRVGIAGVGEVGSAIENLLIANDHDNELQYYIYDPNKGYTTDISRCKFIHVCTPADQVNNIIARFGNDPIYIIHSTLKPETDWCDLRSKIYHAPIRGRHPKLGKAIANHIMMISCPKGGLNDEFFKRTQEYLERYVTRRVRPVEGYINTQLAKVLCTTQLGLDVIFMRAVWDLCKKHGADFNVVYKDWRRDYNSGFTSTNEPHFTRPILEAMEGKIGGHCVVPNAEMCKDIHPIFDLIAEEGKVEWKK